METITIQLTYLAEHTIDIDKCLFDCKNKLQLIDTT